MLPEYHGSRCCDKEGEGSYSSGPLNGYTDMYMLFHFINIELLKLSSPTKRILLTTFCVISSEGEGCRRRNAVLGNPVRIFLATLIFAKSINSFTKLK